MYVENRNYLIEYSRPAFTIVFKDELEKHGDVRPKKPFFEWLNAILKDERQIHNKEENNVYLFREMDNNEEIRA